jgi:hypothetical protein
VTAYIVFHHLCSIYDTFGTDIVSFHLFTGSLSYRLHPASSLTRPLDVLTRLTMSWRFLIPAHTSALHAAPTLSRLSPTSLPLATHDIAHQRHIYSLKLHPPILRSLQTSSWHLEVCRSSHSAESLTVHIWYREPSCHCRCRSS